MTCAEAIAALERIVPNDDARAIEALVVLKKLSASTIGNLSPEGHPIPTETPGQQ